MLTPTRLLLRLARAAIEVAVLTMAFVAAFAYRFDFAMPPDRVSQLLVLLVPVVVVEVAWLRALGTHRHSWRYTTLDDLVDVGLALAGTTLLLVVLRMAPATPDLLQLPYGVSLANGVLAGLGLAGARVVRRLAAERREAARRSSSARGRTRRVVLVGAGRAGVMVAKEIEQRPELGLHPVGFLDDDPNKAGLRIAGIFVRGTTDEVPQVVAATGAEEAIITMASVDRVAIRRILDRCAAANVSTKIIPSLYEIVGGRVNLDRIRPVDVEDLLGRDPVELDQSSLQGLLDGRTVMITGAGGSIGSELARQAARFDPARLVLFERAEPALWAIHRELVRDFPTIEVEAVIGDVCDQARVRRTFERLRPDVVVHAAAHKHVPLMEDHPGEAVKNNVGGTRTVADIAAEYGVERFVLVSTDKAVNPSSVMGATKRVAERYVQHLAAATGIDFLAVRFGNVLGSTGSVVPIFREQVRQGGPVTVTHPEIVRYFMTIPEASGLVLQAAALGKGGEILMLDMGEPVKILDLAENLIRLSGFEPGRDVQIEFIGLRPGEKMFEELSLSEENADRTRHPKVWIGHNEAPHWNPDESDIRALLRAADAAPPDGVRAHLQSLVPEFTNGTDPAPRLAGNDVPGIGTQPPTHDAASATPL